MVEIPSNNQSNHNPSRFKLGFQKTWQGLVFFLEVIGLRQGKGADHTPQVARLKLNHAEFRKLLSANNSFLETMTDIEQKYLVQAFLDRTYLRRRVLRAIADIHTMIEAIMVISKGRYPVLRDRFEEIVFSLTKLIEGSGNGAPLVWVRDLSAVDRNQTELAGGKAANLGEIRNALDLPTPEGFVVTTEGFRLLLEKGGLKSWLQDRDLEILAAQDVEEISRSIQDQFLKIHVPSSLNEAILGAYDRLTQEIGKEVSLAVRSSALGEDSGFSFAGQFLTLLNINREGLVEAYLKVAASLYSSEAIHYRRLHGIPGHSAEMAVAFITMVDAMVSGVSFSKDPNQPESDQILIQAVRGLGVPLVEGQTSPEVISVPRDLNRSRIVRLPSQQKFRLILSSQSELKEDSVSPDEAEQDCLSDEEAILLGQWALLLEDHFGSPQDIEWAMDRDRKLILLQSRPLRLLERRGETSRPLPGYPLLLSGGDVACPGTGTGPAFHMAEDDDPNSFPDGGVLIAKRSSPRFVRLMSKVRAIVTDFGSTTGHMASLSREFGVPTLLNTKMATQKIPQGSVITVDATNGLVYQGQVPVPEWKGTPSGRHAGSIEEKPSHPELQLLEKVIELIQPLNLTDPLSKNFRGDQCRTLHDLARFIHEKSYEEMFILGEQLGDLRASSYHLDVFLPIDLYLIDLGGGVEGVPKQGKIKRSQISSIPLTALLDGMLDEKIPRFGPKPMDYKGFFSIMMRHAVNTPEGEQSFQDPCYAIISDNYLNYTARVGYHFSVVDTYCSSTPNKNYISLTFRGGAADLIRRTRRSRAIAAILRTHGFHVGLAHDVVTARLGKATQEEMIEHLKMIGSLFQFFRQMDVSMMSEDSVEQFKDAFLRGDYDFGQKD
jgi:pyruvate, water dikinase